jgi:hypothetical protein
MKTLLPARPIFLSASLLLAGVLTVAAQSGGSQYPSGGYGGSRGPAAPAHPPAKPALPPGTLTFGQLTNHSSFYFVSDTNRVNLWIKTSSSTASNTVNQKTATLTAQTPVKSK